MLLRIRELKNFSASLKYGEVGGIGVKLLHTASSNFKALQRGVKFIEPFYYHRVKHETNSKN
jgi:hypothetical protein